MDIRLDSTGLRVVPLRARTDAPAAARSARETEDADTAPAPGDVGGARDLVLAVVDAVRARPDLAGALHGTQRTAVLSLLA